MCPDGVASGNESELFPYSVSGFIAEPSQSAQRPRTNPAAVQSDRLRLTRGTMVCVLFCEIAGPASVRFLHQTRGAPEGVKRRCRPCVLFCECSAASPEIDFPAFAYLRSVPPCRLTAQDPGLSSRGIRVRLPSGRPFSLRKRRFSIRDRSSLCPIGSE